MIRWSSAGWLDAAADLIQRRGVAAVTLDDVERAAGVGRSQLYHYFDDRTTSSDPLSTLAAIQGGLLLAQIRPS